MPAPKGRRQSELEWPQDAETREGAEAAVIYPFDSMPLTGQAMQVAPGVVWIRRPLPFRLDHINPWAIADGDASWAIVDAGLRSEETAAAWRRLFATALGNRPLSRVFVTHMHPDHIGMAGWLTRRLKCRLWMTRLADV